MELFSVENLTSQEIANHSVESFKKLPSKLQELLLQTKNEQTLSGLISNQFQNFVKDIGSTLVLELKGVDYREERTSTKKPRLSRNFHDIVIVNADAVIQTIIENKVWYHFDGAKGRRKPSIGKGIIEQIQGDLEKIQITLSESSATGKGFLLIHLVTPNDHSTIPKSYKPSYKSSMHRTNGNLEQYRKDGVSGVIQALEGFTDELVSISHAGSISEIAGGPNAFLDVICAEINIDSRRERSFDFAGEKTKERSTFV